MGCLGSGGGRRAAGAHGRTPSLRVAAPPARRRLPDPAVPLRPCALSYNLARGSRTGPAPALRDHRQGAIPHGDSASAALPALLGAGTITMVRLNHRRLEGGRGGERAPTGFVRTPQGPSASPWPHQGASRHGSVFARPALTTCLYAPTPSPATASSQAGHPTAEKAQVSKKGRAHAARPVARTVRKVMICAKRFLFDGAGSKLFHYELVSSMEWPNIIKHRGLVSNSRQSVRDVISSSSSSSSNRMMKGTSKIQVIVQIDNFGSLPLPFEDGCTIQEIVSAAFRKRNVCIPDAVLRFNGRNAYPEDRVCSLNTGNSKVCTLYIRPRLRGGQPPSPSSSIPPVRELFALYLSSLGDDLFDVVTPPQDPDLFFIGMERYFISLGFTAIQITIMLFELLENFHERPECVSRFTLADLDYDSSSKRLMFRDTVGLVPFDLATYYQNMSDAGGIVSAIFQFDELKVLGCRRGIHLPPGTVRNNHSRLPKLVQFLVYDLQTGVRAFPGAGTNKRKRAYFRCHVAVMTPAQRLAFWMTSELHFDYIGDERQLDYYLAVKFVPDWSTQATRSTAMKKVYDWRTYDACSLGHQWSIARNWLAHAKLKLTQKITEKQAEAYLHMIFECLMYYVLLRIFFDKMVINWNTRPIPEAQPPPPPPYFRTPRVGPPLRVNNHFTLYQLVDMAGSL
ncbi:uncharacterized protein [Triticum aestivum]|uniref:uncharacterized protein n=1 Tax=Triticum aestivum TaxID=4565 RepID=UPI001D01DF44|nr:uncharacterized protein LOC123084145 [Triticum aestivum]